MPFFVCQLFSLLSIFRAASEEKIKQRRSTAAMVAF